MNLDLNVLITLLFGAGGTGAIVGLTNVVKTWRGGKIESEETLIKRLDADNRKQQELRIAAERHADEAEAEAEEYRRQRNAAQEKLARLRWHYIEKTGEQPPEFGDPK